MSYIFEPVGVKTGVGDLKHDTGGSGLHQAIGSEDLTSHSTGTRLLERGLSVAEVAD